ncbi:MAG: polysaccharide pyruvyl transferase family protein [Schaedlerella sp.]|nr:polysaccharide pyruvyl transferase family protein [Schaedlerella sp.]
MERKRCTIKTITCHDVYNTGASLQAYALSAYLKSLGHDVEIIDYKPDYLKHYELWGVRNPQYNRPIFREIYNLLKLPGRIRERLSKRKKSFDRFTKMYLPVTSKSFHTNEEMRQANIEADIFFAGSDQIWNTIFQNGKDPSFYLDFASEDAVRASYAASFATEDLAKDYKRKVASWLNKMDFISVREKSAIDILEKMGFHDGKQVVDPVFLLNKQEWETLLNNKKNSEKYLLIYDFDNNQAINSKALELSKRNGWKIYSIFPNMICDRCFFDEGPLEFVKLIKDAEIILSNSFHATAFSIIFEKQFIVFERNEKINTRMRDLLMGLEILMNGRVIEYNKVNILLSKQIRESKQYIDHVISAVRKE